MADTRRHRWTLKDPATGEIWEFEMNPNKMTSPHASRSLQVFPTATIYNPAVEARGGMVRALERPGEPYEWSFSGSIRSEEQYRQLIRWTRKLTRVHLTDHLGRTWLIRFTEFRPDEKHPTARREWRFTYEVKALMYGAVA